MDPVEINAGSFYLREMRADDHIDDRLALAEAFADSRLRRVAGPSEVDEYVARRAHEWAVDERCSWAIAQPQTGGLVGEVALARLTGDWREAEVGCWVAPAWRGQGAASTSVAAALRFGAGALGVVRAECAIDQDDPAAARVAEKCGFRPSDGRPGVVVWEP